MSSSLASRVVRLLLLGYVLSIVLLEARLGLSGLILPHLTVLAEEGVGGAPFIGEWFLIGAVILSTLDALTCESRGPMEQGIRDAFLVNVYWCILVLSVVALLSVPQGPSALSGLRMLAEGLALFYCVFRLEWSNTFLASVLSCFLLVGIFHSGVIVIDFVAPGIQPFDTNVIIEERLRYAGLFMQPSRAALLCGLVLVVGAGFVLLNLGSVMLRIFAVLGVLLSPIAALLTQTRSVVLAAILALVALVSCAGATRILRKKVLIAAAAVGAVSIVTAIASGAFGLFRERVDSLGSGNDRATVYEIVIRIILEWPFGAGIGGLEPASGAAAIPHAHNMYLQWSVMFGFVGVGLFAVLLYRIYAFNWQAIRKGLDLEGRALRMILLATFVLFLGAFLFEPYLMTNVGGWFWLICGLMASGAQGPGKVG